MKDKGLFTLVLGIILIFLTSSQANAAYCEKEKQAYDDEYYYLKSLEDSLENIADEIISEGEAGNLQDEINGRRREINEDIQETEKYLSEAKEILQQCISKTKEIDSNSIPYFQGIELSEKGNFTEAIKKLENFVSSNPHDQEAKRVLGNMYTDYAIKLNDEGKYSESIIQFKKSIKLGIVSYYTYYNLGIIYHNMGIQSRDPLDYDNSAYYYERAFEMAKNDTQRYDAYENYEDVLYYKPISKQPTNDPLIGDQYYLNHINIGKAWEKVTNNNEVIVAVIDDGVYINHPDLKNNIWNNPNGKYGDSKVINFTDDDLGNFSIGDHGTMVAGIIGASQNNGEGIAGIAKNVKIMPIRIYGTATGTTLEEDINYFVKAIDFAIDNGANVINISSSYNQRLNYISAFDEVMQKAYKNNVVVVISAGNGDEFALGKTGLDLSINPTSPVCNNEAKYKYSIGVMATGREGFLTNWTNYGDCATMYAPGVGILSTSIPAANTNSYYGENYKTANGTSFSAPIIAGIVALGYNQFGKVDPAIVFDALTESSTYSEVDGHRIDAAKYLDIIEGKINNTSSNTNNADNNKTQTSNTNSNTSSNTSTQTTDSTKTTELQQNTEKAFVAIKNIVNKNSKNQQKIMYIGLYDQLLGLEPKFTGDKKIIINHLIDLINKELKNY